MVLEDPMQEMRKRDHITLTEKAQTKKSERDSRFYYEPLLGSHAHAGVDLSTSFMGKKMAAPLWVSSMTGGVGEGRHINQNLARVCREFSLGMGLGSCRALLSSKEHFKDFNLRPILGPELPFFANLGIAQLERLAADQQFFRLEELVESLDADGLIIHVNPLQEWFQPEGDKILRPPLETLTDFCQVFSSTGKKIIVKEVGQGMGPKSLAALLALPIDGLELAGFGGTNFSKLELLRNEEAQKKGQDSLALVGHSAVEMIGFLNDLLVENPAWGNKEIIISGGVEDFLDGFYLQSLLHFPSVIGQAKNFLSRAQTYEELKAFTAAQIEGLKMARTFLTVKAPIAENM